MDFQFDESVDRRNTGSMKWDVAKGNCPCGWLTWILGQHLEL